MPDATPDPKPFDWDEQIKKSLGKESHVAAVTFLRRRTDTASRPVYLGCDGGRTYVVKPLRRDTNQGRMLFNDHIIARFGAIVDAAVPAVSLVSVSKELIDLNPHPTSGMGDCRPAVWHGSQQINDVTERVDRFNHIRDERSFAQR